MRKNAMPAGLWAQKFRFSKKPGPPCLMSSLAGHDYLNLSEACLDGTTCSLIQIRSLLEINPGNLGKLILLLEGGERMPTGYLPK
jgi:hypothetical protein